MGRLFGTNGVRGVANEDLTVQKVTRLSATIGTYLGNEIAVGRDGRITSPMFRDAVVSGLLSVGSNVHDAGILPTPTLQYAIKKFCLDGGIMITASHNPPEFNGIKVIAPDGVEIPREHENQIEDIYFSDGPKLCSWDKIGKLREIHAIEPYIHAVKSHVDSEAIGKANLKIAIDPGNGVAALTAPEIARDLGCKVYTVNVNINGTFPGRDSEPRPDNLDALKSLVKASKADLGVAFDGDGDRSMFVDDRGEIQWGDKSVTLLAKDFLNKNPGERIVSAVNSSKVLDDVVADSGGSVLKTKVGSVVISRTMVEQKIKFGGEENGGIMYGPHLEVRDGSMAMALMLELIAKSRRPLSELFSDLPKYHQIKDKVYCPEDLKEKALEALHKVVKAPEVVTIDGVKLIYHDDSWILFRPSGTEPVFRIYAEAKDYDKVKEMVDNHKALIVSVIESLG